MHKKGETDKSVQVSNESNHHKEEIDRYIKIGYVSYTPGWRGILKGAL